MESIRLTAEGSLLDKESKAIADSLPALSQAVALDEGCTLRSFFSMLSRYPVLQSLSPFLPVALEEAGKCGQSGCRSDDLDLLVVGKTMELIGFPGKPRAEIYMWIRGLALAPEGDLPTARGGDGPNDDQATTLAAMMEAGREIRFIPPQLLLDTPLLLGGMKHVVLGDVNRNLFCETRFTLFEVVDGLAWELGFQGGTQQCSLGR